MVPALLLPAMLPIAPIAPPHTPQVPAAAGSQATSQASAISTRPLRLAALALPTRLAPPAWAEKLLMKS